MQQDGLYYLGLRYTRVLVEVGGAVDIELEPGVDTGGLAITGTLTRGIITYVRLACSAKAIFENCSERASIMRLDVALAKAVIPIDLNNPSRGVRSDWSSRAGGQAQLESVA